MLCDCAQCTRAFHLGCLGIEAVPEGTWFCRYHNLGPALKETEPREFMRWHLLEALRTVAGTACALPFLAHVSKDGACIRSYVWGDGVVMMVRAGCGRIGCYFVRLWSIVCA